MIPVPQWLLKRGLSEVAVLTYGVLATGETDVTTMADTMGTSNKKVQRAITELRSAGLLLGELPNVHFPRPSGV